MHIGVVLPQVGADWDEVLDAARHAEEVGADSVWVIDHMLGFPPDQGILEAWTLLSALAASTERVELGAQVFCQSFRSPALFAKMAATLDRVSGGRFRLLIGAGWHEPEYQSFGWDFPPPGVLVEQLQETIRILKGMLRSTDPFTYEGKHYRVNEAVNAPPPIRVPIPIEVGGGRDRIMRTIAREADGWNCPGAALPALENRLEVLAAECKRYGRSIEDLRLTCQIVCAVGDDDAASDPRLGFYNPQMGFTGSVDAATERAKELIAKGIEGFHVVVSEGAKGRAALERLINEVRPNVS